jgi:hypothetical protein
MEKCLMYKDTRYQGSIKTLPFPLPIQMVGGSRRQTFPKKDFIMKWVHVKDLSTITM